LSATEELPRLIKNERISLAGINPGAGESDVLGSTPSASATGAAVSSFFIRISEAGVLTLSRLPGQYECHVNELPNQPHTGAKFSNPAHSATDLYMKLTSTKD